MVFHNLLYFLSSTESFSDIKFGLGLGSGVLPSLLFFVPVDFCDPGLLALMVVSAGFCVGSVGFSVGSVGRVGSVWPGGVAQRAPW